MEWIVGSGWRDLNSRPLDPQIGGSLNATATQRSLNARRRTKSKSRDLIGRPLGLSWAQFVGSGSVTS